MSRLPSARRSTTTSAGPSFTGRSGASSVFARATCISTPRHLGSALFEKGFQSRLGFVLALRDGRSKSLGGEAAGGISAGNAWQQMHGGVICERGIAGDACGKLERLGMTLAILDKVM